MFKALIISQNNEEYRAEIQSLEDSELPEGNVTVAVDYSSLNYKDGLAITGKGKIIRNFPMIPGIDFAGEVVSSDDKRYSIGDKVILTGWGVGENHWGGIAEKARVHGDWLVPMPTTLDARKAMIIGTAGLTAMLCIQGLIDNGVHPESGAIVVTGASGGVGSVAVNVLSKMGYQVTAVTGRTEENGALLKALGAATIIEREAFAQPAKPLEKSQFAGAIDTVGSKTLAKVLAQMNYNGVVTACGLAGGMDLPTTVMPFILRGVTLVGIDSVQCPREKRIQAWDTITKWLPDSYYETASQEISLTEVVEVAEKITEGEVTGRTLIKL